LPRANALAYLTPLLVSKKNVFLTVAPCGVAETYGDPVAVVDDDAAVVAVTAVPDGGCVKG
jgi:hypothetical protein